MKLFGDFEAVRFPEEDIIFITRENYIFYVYKSKSNRWQKYHRAGDDFITLKNYEEVSKSDIVSAMGGIYPQRETDFLRLCDTPQLWICDMLALLKEDYPIYMSDYEICNTVGDFFAESKIRYKSYKKVRELLEEAYAAKYSNDKVLSQIKDLSFSVVGRDIFKKEIRIFDGHASTSYFWIMPVRVVDFENTDDLDNVAELNSNEISIEEMDVEYFLTPFLFKYFDENIEANKKRVIDKWVNDEGIEKCSYIEGFEWWLSYNFYTYDAFSKILTDIHDTIDALSTGRENEYTQKLEKNMEHATVEMLIDFYRRFTYRMEYMMKVGKENGYDLISVMGP